MDVVWSHCDPIPERKPGQASTYDSVHTECCDLDEGIVNARLDTSNADEDGAAWLTSVPTFRVNWDLLKHSGITTGPPYPRGAPVPIHVLNCVYLD